MGCGTEGVRSVGVQEQTGLTCDWQRTVKYRADVKTPVFQATFKQLNDIP